MVGNVVDNYKYGHKQYFLCIYTCFHQKQLYFPSRGIRAGLVICFDQLKVMSSPSMT